MSREERPDAIRFVVLAEVPRLMDRDSRRTVDLFVASNQVVSVQAYDLDPMRCWVQFINGQTHLVRGSPHEIAQHIFGGSLTSS